MCLRVWCSTCDTAVEEAVGDLFPTSVAWTENEYNLGFTSPTCTSHGEEKERETRCNLLWEGHGTHIPDVTSHKAVWFERAKLKLDAGENKFPDTS